ncbi:hypothetical protein GCM10009754_26310 [Amycolatopsis minnesotensis]|uniref:Uncharacterized protein n=1 Tax=Amycolatopsis minnesotensis TaxID=337894 RepID=A0ABN2QNC0_9PSEU
MPRGHLQGARNGLETGERPGVVSGRRVTCPQTSTRRRAGHHTGALLYPRGESYYGVAGVVPAIPARVKL